MPRRIHRRHFLMSASAAAAGLMTGHRGGRARGESPSDRVRIACIGVGGKGSSDTDHAALCGEVVALCDIDAQRLDTKSRQYPHARTYRDFRTLLDEMAARLADIL